MARTHWTSIIGIPIMLLAVYGFYLSGPPWNTARGAAAIYSVLAFLFVTLTASLGYLQRIDDSPAHIIYSMATGYSAVVFAGAAVFYTFQAQSIAIHTRSAGIFLNLVAFANAGLLVLGYAYRLQKAVAEDSRRYSKTTNSIIVFVLAGIFVMFMFIARSPLPEIYFLIGGYVAGAIATGSFLISALIFFQKRNEMQLPDPVRLSKSIVFISAASFVLVLILPGPSSIWVFSMGFMAIGLIYATVAVVHPYLLETGVKKRIAYFFAIGINLIVVLPFLVAYYIEGLVPGFVFIDIGFSTVNHIGLALLAGGSAYLLHSRSAKSPAPWRSPIVLLFIFWCVAEFAVGVSPFITSVYQNSETVVPYIIGAIVSTLLLTIAYGRTLVPKQDVNLQPTMTTYLSMVAISFLLLIGGELISSIGSVIIPIQYHTPLAAAFMLLFGYAALFALLNLSFALVGIYGGHLTIDSNLAGLNTVWIIGILLRANFTVWTAGWWMSELVFLGATMISILYLVKTYVEVIERRNDFESRMRIQKNILTSELLSRLNVSTEIIERLGTERMVDKRLDLVSKSLSELSRAEDIVRYMNVILLGKKFAPEDLSNIGLAEMIQSVITQEIYGVTPTIETIDDDCYIAANTLLIDAIKSLLKITILRVGTAKAIEVVVQRDDDTTTCIADISMRIETENAVTKRDLISRYVQGPTIEATEISYAKRLIDLFDATIQFTTEAIGEDQLETTIIMRFPLAKNHVP
ncbi:MAG: hypothetical protein K9W43_11635 [Candidatus Thorarchaeota archaeon]|nr:hypothetical protein [Candidatus Thorarchaeota archaeon]